VSGRRDDGTVIPLLVLGFLLAGTLLAASVAGSAALVAHRRLAAACDGAALAGAAAVDRTRLASPTIPARAATAAPADPATPADPAAAGEVGRRGIPGGARVLPLDRRAAARSAIAYLATAVPGVGGTASTDGATVTVRCAWTVRVPFEAVIAHPHGIRETATARASTMTRPST
jgi:hypothetical protein